jgi:toluene monooxygenase system ferredoxin subunit
VDGVGVLIVRAGDQLRAVQSLCPHEAVPLDLGVVDGERLTCLEHMWQFDLRSGAPLGDEATQGLRTFPVRSDGDDLYVSLG